MFSVFSNGNFIGFWGNKKEDVWAPATVKNLNLSSPEIFWHETDVVPELYRFDGSKNLVIQVKNELDEVVDTEVVYTAEPYSF